VSEVTIAETVGALDAMAQAVRDNNQAAYKAALARARELGCTSDQILDAYEYGLRTKGEVSFWVSGADKNPITEDVKRVFFERYRHHMDNESPSCVFALEDVYRRIFNRDLTNDANRAGI
jgi:hypothetical protein